MLILTRRLHEEIVCTLTESLPAGTRFRISCEGSDMGKARIGIDAPRTITIDRSEIHRRKLRNREDINGNMAEPAEHEET